MAGRVSLVREACRRHERVRRRRLSVLRSRDPDGRVHAVLMNRPGAFFCWPVNITVAEAVRFWERDQPYPEDYR